MSTRKHLIYMAAICFSTIFLTAGCGSDRLEEQEAFRQQGISDMENGNYEEALDAFQEALDLSLGKVGEVEMDICFYKAQTQFLMQDTEGAIATYTAIIDYNKNPKAYFSRGNVYYYLEDEENALKDYEAAVANEKKDYDLYIGIYEALTAHDKQEEGAQYLEKALEIKGETAYDKMKKGWIHFLLGEYEEATALLTEAKEGGEKEADYCLTQLYLATGDTEAAQESMNAYLASEVADSYRLYDIAKVQMEQENYDIAITCLEAARGLESVPNKQTVLRTLAVAYEKKQDFQSAREVLESYVELYPDDDDAARELTFLETR